jgi:hypothetical protein
MIKESTDARYGEMLHPPTRHSSLPSAAIMRATPRQCRSSKTSRKMTYLCPAMSKGFLYCGGISADRLAASMPKNTTECMTIAITSTQAMSSNTFELRAYIMSNPR